MYIHTLFMFPASTGCTLTLCHISRYAGSSFHSRHLYFSWRTLNKIFSRFLSFRPTVASRGGFSGLVMMEFSIHKVRRYPCFKNRCLRYEEGLLTWEFVGVYVWFYCFGKCITIRSCSVLVRFISFTVIRVVLKEEQQSLKLLVSVIDTPRLVMLLYEINYLQFYFTFL